jgi:Haem-degrading
MNAQSKTLLASMVAIVIATAIAGAQQAPTPPPTIPYGAPIGLEAAKKVMAAAEAEAVKNNWGMAIAILDSTGHIVMLHKLDNTQYGSIAVAEDKARSALYFRRPSKVASECARSRCAEPRRSRAAFPSSRMARLWGPSASPARPRYRMAKSPRLVPTRRSEQHLPRQESRHRGERRSHFSHEGSVSLTRSTALFPCRPILAGKRRSRMLELSGISLVSS